MKPSRFVLTGARDTVPPDDLVDSVLSWALSLALDTAQLVHGVAAGVDSTLSERAKERGFDVHWREAPWDQVGKFAGPKRNGEMLDGLCDCHEGAIVIPRMVLAFHDDLRRSKGTLDCIIQAGQRQIPVCYWGYQWPR